MKIHAQATEEIHAAVAFYRSKAVEIAFHFVAELEEGFKKIAENPLAYPIHTEHVRKFTMHHFPFNILCTSTDSDIAVLAVMHQRRKPGYWKDRI